MQGKEFLQLHSLLRLVIEPADVVDSEGRALLRLTHYRRSRDSFADDDWHRTRNAVTVAAHRVPELMLALQRVAAGVQGG